MRPVPQVRREADIVFTRSRVAVFVDGCFWHRCPDHGRVPSANAGWWEEKLALNQARDEDTNRQLREQGWTVVRIWEHEDPDEAAHTIEGLVRARDG